MSTLKVFVSHSHEDDAFCQLLVAALRHAEADVWYDEHNLGAGQLIDTVERELRARTVFVLILSPAALRSQWVRDETKWAFTQLRREPERILLPVLASAVEENDIWLFLQDFKRIEAPGGHPFAADEAVRRTLLDLALTPAGEMPIAQVPQPSESAEELVTRGKALQAQGDHAGALPFFERATQRDPQAWSSWQSLGYIFAMLNRYDEALRATERAIVLNAGNVVSWNDKGNALCDLKRYLEALAAYEQALDLDPKYATAWTGKGNALYSLTRPAEALAAYEQALALDPNLTFAWNGTGNVLHNLRRYPEALAAFERALDLDPNLAFAWTGKGNALYDLKRYPEALAAFERRLDLAEPTAVALTGKALTLRALGRPQEAEQAEAQAEALSG